MIVGVPTERDAGESRVAIVPAVVPALVKSGLEILLEAGAGAAAGFPDADYVAQGARIAGGRDQAFRSAECVVRVRPLDPKTPHGREDLARLRPGMTVVGLLDPLGNPGAARALAERRATAFALELLPRISRAQSMDALTSMATIAGYKAVLIAAAALPTMCPMMMTAAGTVAPSKFLVLGAGVAGLQAIATARRLGAVVSAYDVRPAVREQVESLGARFVDLGLDTVGAEGAGGYAKEMDEEFYRKQREGLARHVAESDAVVTTAAIPGGRAPLLVTADAVRRMRSGSIVVDLAAESGGNCELTKCGETVEEGGVAIAGPVQLAATVPRDASLLFARNLTAFLKHVVKEGRFAIDRDDPIASETLVSREGEIVAPRVCEKLGPSEAAKGPAERRTV